MIKTAPTSQKYPTMTTSRLFVFFFLVSIACQMAGQDSTTKTEASRAWSAWVEGNRIDFDEGAYSCVFTRSLIVTYDDDSTDVIDTETYTNSASWVNVDTPNNVFNQLSCSETQQAQKLVEIKGPAQESAVIRTRVLTYPSYSCEASGDEPCNESDGGDISGSGEPNCATCNGGGGTSGGGTNPGAGPPPASSPSAMPAPSLNTNISLGKNQAGQALGQVNISAELTAVLSLSDVSLNLKSGITIMDVSSRTGQSNGMNVLQFVSNDVVIQVTEIPASAESPKPSLEVRVYAASDRANPAEGLGLFTFAAGAPLISDLVVAQSTTSQGVLAVTATGN